MPPPRKKHRDLPPRMIVRTYTNKRGEVWKGYYYEHPRDENGKRRVESLGSDLAMAKKKWAEKEGEPYEDETAIGTVYKKYMEWAAEKSDLAPRTIRDRLAYWRQLDPVFGKMKINKVEPQQFLVYFHNRTSQVSAKKEIKFMSALFSWARARGFMQIENPIPGITRQMKVKEGRDIYVSDSDLDLVYKHGSDVIRDAMDIAYLTGQRPADVRKMRWDHIKDGVLHITQNKTKKKIRINVVGPLAEVLDRIKKRSVLGMTILADAKGMPLSQFGHFRNQFNKARDLAEAEAKELGVPFTRFQFRDLRAKVATDLGIRKAQLLLGHETEKMTAEYVRDNEAEAINPMMAKSPFAKSVGNNKKKAASD